VTYGPERLYAELRELGFQVRQQVVGNGISFAVIEEFTVPCGRFIGRTIDLGLQAMPDFPRTVASAIHVRADPQLLDYGDTKPGVRNITKSPLGSEWRYWSHNFGWTGEKSARRLLSQINTIFANA
jgi:hypothetical protein